MTQCKGKRKDNEACNALVKEGEEYCYHHRKNINNQIGVKVVPSFLQTSSIAVGLMLTFGSLGVLGILLFYPFGYDFAIGKGTWEILDILNVVLILLDVVILVFGLKLLATNLNKNFLKLRVVCTLIVIVLVLSTGYGVINAIYSAAPLTLSYAHENSSVTCTSFYGKAIPSVDDVLKCSLIYDGLCNESNYTRLSIANDSEQLGSTSNGFPNSGSCENNKLTFTDVRKQISKEGHNTITFQLYDLRNQSLIYEDKQLFIEYEAITQDAYNNRNNTRFQGIVAVLTLGLFSSIAATKNFLDILDS